MSQFNLNEEWVSVFGHPPDSAEEKQFFATMEKVGAAGQMESDALRIMLENGAQDIKRRQKLNENWPDGQEVHAQVVAGFDGIIETVPAPLGQGGGYFVRVAFSLKFKNRQEAHAYGARAVVRLNE